MVLRFRRPDGRLLPEVPRSPEVSGDPAEVLRPRQEAEGLVMHARTAMPGWMGERLEVGWAIDVLHPLATVSSRTAAMPRSAPRVAPATTAPLPAVGEAGATVVCTGRSTRPRRSDYNRAETIEETAELVTHLGGTGIAAAVDPRSKAAAADVDSAARPDRANFPTTVAAHPSSRPA